MSLSFTCYQGEGDRSWADVIGGSYGGKGRERDRRGRERGRDFDRDFKRGERLTFVNSEGGHGSGVEIVAEARAEGGGGKNMHACDWEE